MAETNEKQTFDQLEEIRHSVDGYRIDSLIGKGSIGAVYKATDSGGKSVAIKIMQVNPLFDTAILDSVIEGASEVKRISNKANIVKIYDFGRNDQCYFIVMELFENGTLEKFIGDKRVKLDMKMNIFHSIANTLTYVHSMGIIHADLKPSNVLMDENDQPYLNDFYHASNANRTAFGAGIPQGTPRYMSPEQALGKFVNPSSDIYSLGVLMYELVTGDAPYEIKAENISSMINIIQNGKIVSPKKRNRRVGGKLEAVIMKSLEKDPDDRYASMKQLTSDLKNCIERKPISIPYKKSCIEKFFNIFRS